MKELFFVCILSICNCSSVLCQDWFQIGAEWYYDQQEQLEYPAHGYGKYSIVKDTIINTYASRLVLLERHAFSDNHIISIDSIYIREESDQVFRWDGTQFKLLYDFTLNAEDTLDIAVTKYGECESLSPIIVDSITTIDVNGMTLQVQHISFSYMSHDQFHVSRDSIVERIGRLTGFNFEPNCGTEYWNTDLLRCYTDNDITYKSQWWINAFPEAACDTAINGSTYFKATDVKDQVLVYPNPCNNILKIYHSTSVILSVRIFNFSGQLMNFNEPIDHYSKIDISEFISGIYYVIIETENLTMSKTIIKP